MTEDTFRLIVICATIIIIVAIIADCIVKLM